MDRTNHFLEVCQYQAVLIPLVKVLEQLCESFCKLSLYLLSFSQKVLGGGCDAGEALDDNIHVTWFA